MVGSAARSALGVGCSGDVVARFGLELFFTLEATLGSPNADGSVPAKFAAAPVSADPDLTAATAGRGMVTRDRSAASMRAAADLVRAKPVA